MAFIRKFFLFINIFLALCLVAGGISIYINPAHIWIFSFFGLFYSVFVVFNLLFVFVWLIFHYHYAFISIVAIVITYPVLKTHFSFRIHNEEKNGAATHVKVLSYNVRNFDLYNWTRNVSTMNKMMLLIKKEDADVACFQEFYNSEAGKFQTIKRLMNECGYRYYRFEKNVVINNINSWGIAIFSKHRITNYGSQKFKNSKNSAMYCDIKIDSSIVRVFNVHLQSVHFSEKDYDYIKEFSEEQNVEVRPTRAIASKLKRGFQTRSAQTIQVSNLIKASPYPVIVCGDFNDTPASFCYHTISGNNLQDAFLSSRLILGATYDGIPPIFRIDYILASKKFFISDFIVVRKKYSDHFPVSCTISFPNGL